MLESYDERLNILIHGIKEDGNNAWEKQEKTIEKFIEFCRHLESPLLKVSRKSTFCVCNF